MTDRDLADKYVEIEERLTKHKLEPQIRENLEFYLKYVTEQIVGRFVKKYASEKQEAK